MRQQSQQPWQQQTQKPTSNTAAKLPLMCGKSRAKERPMGEQSAWQCNRRKQPIGLTCWLLAGTPCGASSSTAGECVSTKRRKPKVCRLQTGVFGPAPTQCCASLDGLQWCPKPAVKVVCAAEHVWHEEVQQGPQLCQLVLQRRACPGSTHSSTNSASSTSP